MKKCFLFLFITVSSLYLVGCSNLPKKYQVIHNSTNDYQQAVSLPPIVVPPTYSSTQFKEKYVVPNPQLAGNKTPVSLVPPTIDTSKNTPDSF